MPPHRKAGTRWLQVNRPHLDFNITMNLIKIFLLALSFLTLSLSSFSQKLAATKIDSICKKIDSLSITFKKVAIKSASSGKLISIQLYYIDTLSNAFRKVLYQQLDDKVINTYYYKDRQLIKLELSKKAEKKESQLSVYYFQNGQVIYKADRRHPIKNLKPYLDNAKEYLDDPVIIH